MWHSIGIHNTGSTAAEVCTFIKALFPVSELVLGFEPRTKPVFVTCKMVVMMIKTSVGGYGRKTSNSCTRIQI